MSQEFIDKVPVTVVYESRAYSGHIAIIHMDEITAYASWWVGDEEGNIFASESRPYFIGDRSYTHDEIIEMVVENMRRYQICRKKFTFVELERYD